VIFGFHNTISGGIGTALTEAARLECRAVQLFIGNPRSYAFAHRSEQEIRDFKRQRQEMNVEYVAIHCSYLVNLASANDRVRSLSLKRMAEELKESAAVGADSYILHPGNYTSSSREEGLERVVLGINQAFIDAGDTGELRLLLENTAGAGTALGSTMEELAYMKSRLSERRIGFCLDTCHAFAAGYDIRLQSVLDGIFEVAERQFSGPAPDLIHLNDAVGLGSLRDRHQNIGDGDIGLAGFEVLLNHPHLADLPIIMETPKASHDSDVQNLRTVLSLLHGR
jgi:deoxyribonuclease IV